MSGWLTVDDLTPRLADLLKLPASDLQTYWVETILPDSLDAAYQDIRSALGARGFTTTQIASWDAGPEYQRDQALFWCLIKGAGLASETGGTFDDKLIARLDRRMELVTVILFDTSGNLIDPGNARISSGVMRNNSDVFIDPHPLRPPRYGPAWRPW